MMGINGKDSPQEIEALVEISKYSQPQQWAIDTMDARIQRMTREIRLRKKICEPKYDSNYIPDTYQIYRLGIRVI